MRSYRFLTTDVFTDRVFGGNPLAVLPDARGLESEAMQAIAREFNLSETTFVLPPEDPAHTRRVRIFTPAFELPFAGHPTVGTALVLARLGEITLAGETTKIVFEEKAGPVPVTIRAEAGEARFAQLAAPQAAEIRKAPEPAAIASLLALDEAELDLRDGLPEAVSCGVPFLLVRVRDQDALARARLDRAVFERLLRGTWAESVFVFTADVAGVDADFRARVFAPAAGIEEDPATGSAAAAFGGWLGTKAGLGDGVHRVVLAQGYEMGRQSRLEIEIENRAGGLAPVRVGGSAVMVMDGTLTVPDRPRAHGEEKAARR